MLRAWRLHVNLIDAALRRGPMGDIPDAPDAQPLRILADTVEAERGKALGWHASELMRAPLQRAIKSVTVLREVHNAWTTACQPRAVVGPPGCGKTHAGAHAVSMQLSSGTPAIFVVARFVDLSQGLPRVLQEVLDRPGWSLRQLLDGLEALAVLSQCADEATEQPSPFKRTLLVLDGLEESVDWQQWMPLMADLAVECKKRPRLRLLLTMRPETARRLDESIPLLIYGPRCESWRWPETHQSKRRYAPTGPPSDDTSSETRQRSAPLGSVGRLF